MSSLDSQENDQFKLISLDGNSIKPVAQKAKHAYSSYLKEEEESGSSGYNVNEDEPEPEPEPPPKAPAKEKPKSVVSKFTQNLEEDDNEDYSENVENIQQKIGELKDSLFTLWSNFATTVSAIFLKIGAILLKPMVKIANIIAKLVSIPLRLVNNIITSVADKLGAKSKQINPKPQAEEVPEPQQQIKLASFSDMIELNIIFTDNYKKTLYNKTATPGFKLSRMEEELIVSMAIEAIKECAEFTAELPPPASGIYEGVPVSQIMEEATEEDVQVFLGFVKAFPGKYIGKTWKISETFATWLINNSPTG